MIDKKMIYPWLIVLCCFLVDAVSLGGRSLFLIVMLLFEEDLKWSVSNLSLVMAIVHVCNGISTPLSGFLVDKFPHDVVIGFGITYLGLCYLFVSLMNSSWHVWFIYGVMTGTAYGLLNLNVFSVAVMKNMPVHRQGIAIGITTSGSTFGQFALVPLFTLASNNYGWRIAFLIISIFTLSLVIPSVLLLRYANNDKVIEINEKHKTEMNEVDIAIEMNEKHEIEMNELDIAIELKKNVTSLLKMPQYWGLASSFFICGITTTGFIESHFVAFGVNNGIGMMEGALAFSVLSAFNGFAVLLAGWLSDYIDRYILLSVIFGGRALTYILLLTGFDENISYTIKLVRLYVFAAFFGLCDYSVVPPTVSLIKTYSPDSVGVGVGVLLLIHSVGAAIGSFIGGVLFEKHQNYDTAIIICLVVCVAASITCYFLKSKEIEDSPDKMKN